MSPLAPSAPAPRSSNPSARAAGAPGAAIPFTAAAHEHVESFNTTTVTPGATVQAFGPFDVPAYGFLRHIFLETIGAGGTIGAGVLSADYPWNLYSSLSVLDVNGAPIYGPLDGYASLWANIIGGHSFRQDPRLSPWFVGTINAQFYLRLPIEISRHNGLGALANQNAAAAYKLNFSCNTSAVMYTTAPTTPATFTIRPAVETWSLPNAVDLAGRPQAQVPPAHGTTQYWSSFIRALPASGAQSILLPRVGNLIRNLIFICRNVSANTPRDDTVMPNPIQVTWDARILTLETQNYRVNKMAEALQNGSTRDAGVFAVSLDNLNNGQSGDEEPNLWLPTVQSTRLEIDGNNTTAGTIQVLTNDVAPAEVLPAERFVETSATGFHPRIGEPAPAAQ